mgnify:CR=1 FL=1
MKKIKPMPFIVDPGPGYTFKVKYNLNEDLFKDSPGYVPLHYHKEYELMYIMKGSGIRIVGNSIENFENNDLVFMGPNLPHVWQGELKKNKESRMTEYIFLCFDPAVFGHEFFLTPEMQDVKSFLDKSSKGFCFSGEIVHETSAILRQMIKEKRAKRFILLLQLLDLLAGSKEARQLNSQAFNLSLTEQETDRMKKVIAYILNHYQQDISVKKIADYAGMSPNSFSRYFKSKTYKNFVDFLHEVRITNAIRMLSDHSLSISDIAYSCGYNSIVNFNRQFKRYTRFSPREYRQKIIMAH